MFAENDHTFVVCAYGESPFLSECLASLRTQTVRTSVLVTTSTPNESIERAARKEGMPLHVSGEAPGIAHDWNYALSLVKTPLATIAHQDDIYEPDYTERMLTAMSSAQQPLIYFTNYGELRNGKKVDNDVLLEIKRMLLGRLRRAGGSSDKCAVKRSVLRLGSAVCCPSVTFNLPLLPKPIFVSKMRSNLDWEAWERISRLDGSFVYDDKILMYHRIHEGSETSALIRNNTRTAEDLAMLEKFWPVPVARLINVFYSLGQRSND